MGLERPDLGWQSGQVPTAESDSRGPLRTQFGELESTAPPAGRGAPTG
jgi:hypothetical protein